MIKQIIKRVIVGVLIALSLTFIRSCKVNALEYIEPYKFADTTVGSIEHYFNPSSFVQYDYWWYKSSSNLTKPKYSVVYDTSNTSKFKRDKLYTGSIIIHNETGATNLDAALTPIVDFNGASCEIVPTDTFLFNQQVMIPGEFIVVMCNNIRFTDNISYFNVWFDINTTYSPVFSFGRFYFNESSTQALIDNIQNNSNQLNNINSSIESSTNDVINNQNQNTESTNSTINDNLTNCHEVNLNFTYKNLKDSVGSVGLTLNGKFQHNDNVFVTGYTNIKSLNVLRTLGSGYNICFYNQNKSLISCIDNTTLSVGEFSLPNGTVYARFTLPKIDGDDVYSIMTCPSKIDETNQSIQEVNDTIKDDNVDDPQDYSSNVASNGVITQLVTLPVTLFQKLLNSTSASCSPFNLGSLYGSNLTMPCINLQNYLGSSLFNVIDILISGLFIYAISRKMVKVFNSLSTMKESDVVNG